jgi:hypothetical protein
MNWFGGRLEFKCIHGRGYAYDNVTPAQAQQILNNAFDDPSRLQEAMYYPYPMSLVVDTPTCVGVVAQAFGPDAQQGDLHA